jgi:hypothetical protein
LRENPDIYDPSEFADALALSAALVVQAMLPWRMPRKG